MKSVIITMGEYGVCFTDMEEGRDAGDIVGEQWHPSVYEADKENLCRLREDLDAQIKRLE